MKDDGPAFPVPSSFNPNNNEPINFTEFGVSKRELFAAMALQGLLADARGVDPFYYEKLAQKSVVAADALIEALTSE